MGVLRGILLFLPSRVVPRLALAADDLSRRQPPAVMKQSHKPQGRAFEAFGRVGSRFWKYSFAVLLALGSNKTPDRASRTCCHPSQIAIAEDQRCP